MSKLALPSDLLLVLGPHRSGSSALTRAISLLGYKLPKTLIKDNSSNRRGHWESQPIVRRNETYMQDANLVWSDWVAGELLKAPAERQRDFEADIAAIVSDEFDPHAPAVLKDPRLCRLMPRYRAALADNSDLKVVIAVRNPLEVMASLMQRNNLSEGNAALLWLRYMLDAVNDSEGLPRAFLSYDRMLDNPVAQFEAMGQALGTTFKNNLNAVSHDIETFLSTGFRHQQSTNEDLLHNDLTNGMISDTYDALRILTQDPTDAQSLQTIKDVSDKLSASERLLGHMMHKFDVDLSSARVEAQSATAAADLRREQIAALREQHRSLENVEASLREELERATTRSAEVEAELSQEVEKLRDRSDELEAEAAKHYQNLQDVERSLRREVKRLRARSGELEAEAASHLHNYLAVTNSTSWRVTRPLRSMISRLRGGGAVPKDAPLPLPSPEAVEEDEKPRPRTSDAQVEKLKASSVFDAEFYTATYAEAQKDPEGPAAHYLNTGWRKGFDPSPLFVTKAYEQSHADLLETDECPALHFIDRYAESYAKMHLEHRDRPKIAVFSAVVGAYDDIKEPAKSSEGVDFFMFTDGMVPAGSVWQTRKLEYVDADPTRSARFVKTHPHLYFADYDYAIWMDANLTLNTHASDFLALVDPSKPVHSWKHPLRICVFEEARTCLELNKDDGDIISADMINLREEHFPSNSGLIETSVVVTTMSHPDVAKLYNEWWARIEKGSRRDQLSLPPALRATGVEMGYIAPERICMRTDPRVIYKRHIHNDRERLLQGKAA